MNGDSFLLRLILTHKLEAFLLSLVALLWLAFLFGLFEKEYNLLDPSLVDEYVFKSPESSNGVEGSVEFSNNILTFTCERTDPTVKITCGAKLVFTGSLEKGIDLSTYDYLKIKAFTDSPAGENRLRLSFKNFHKNYSYLDDDLTHKVNAFLTQNLEGHAQIMPLGLLRVQQWWLNMFRIPLEDSLPDISNVVNMDILVMQKGPAGAYTTTVSTASIHGQYLTKPELMGITIICALIIASSMFREAQLSKSMATTDFLTGLMNRQGMQSWLEQLNPSVEKPINMYLFFIDVDNFKKVNDTHGHKIGDELLAYLGCTVVLLLRDLKTSSGTFSHIRLSGDEFLIIFTDIDDALAHEIAQKVITKLCKKIKLDDICIENKISMGVAAQDVTSTDIRSLIEKADTAMYVAKNNGKSQYQFYDDGMQK